MDSTCYLPLASQLQADLVKHGWGELVFKVSSMKDNTVKVELLCGKSHVFFIKKNLDLGGIL
jgi:hypothetical protein